jgi:hypothetical protein
MGEAGEERANFFPACNRCLHCAAGQLQWGVSQVSILYLVGCLAVFTFDMTEGEDLVGCPTVSSGFIHQVATPKRTQSF